MEGLLRFAELLQWPYLHETKDYAETVRRADSLGLDRASAFPVLWDWLYGLTLPGNTFAHKTMIALVSASKHDRIWHSTDPKLWIGSRGSILLETMISVR
jgi:hypothetical protein